MSKIIPERITAEFDCEFVVSLIGYKFGLKAFVQCRRPFHHLEAYAKSKNHDHPNPWRAFNNALARSHGDYETIYSSSRLSGSQEPANLS